MLNAKMLFTITRTFCDQLMRRRALPAIIGVLVVTCLALPSTTAAQPANDTCETATVITALPYSTNATGDTQHWYRFTAPRTQWVDMHPMGTPYWGTRGCGPPWFNVEFFNYPDFKGSFFLATKGLTYLLEIYGAGPHLISAQCGNGTIENGEQCDDGNTTSGDGCSDTCQVEQCWGCSGAAPSTCTPVANNSACNDGNACTTNDACQSGSCIGTPLANNSACDDGNPCTTNDACQSGSCVGITADPCTLSGKLVAQDLVNIDAHGKSLHLLKSAIITAPEITIQDAADVTIDKGATLRATDGGAISVDGTGTCTLEGKLQTGANADGTGGTIAVTCNGDLTMSKDAKLDASGTSGGAGGSIAASATGDCTVAASMKANATAVLAADPNGGPPSYFGGYGGQVTVNCGSSLLMTKDAKIIAGTAATAPSGNVTLTAGTTLQLDPGAKIQNDGSSQTDSGDPSNAIGIHAGTTCSVGGKLQSKNTSIQIGSGPTVTITCPNGVTLGQKSTILMAGPAASGGDVTVTSTNGACDLSGRIASTGPQLGAGGVVEVDCHTTLNVNKGATIDVSASGAPDFMNDFFSLGGEIFLTTDTDAVTVAGKLTAKSSGDAGMISIIGVGITTTTDSSIDAGSLMPPNVNPSIQLLSETAPNTFAGDIVIGKKLTAKGAGPDNAGGDIEVEGCNVTVQEKGMLSVNGSQAGSNALTAHRALTINGSVSALSNGKDPGTGTPFANGSNFLNYSDSIATPGLITPAATIAGPVPDDPAAASCGP